MHRVSGPGVHAQGFRPRSSGPGVQAQGLWFQVHHQHQLKVFVLFSIFKIHSTQSLQSALQDYADVGVLLEFNTKSIN